MSEPVWLTDADVIRLHDVALLVAGGSEGFLNRSALPGGVERPRHKHHDEGADIWTCAAAYAYGIAKAHAFVDGNKRTAFLACVAFLDANGLTFDAPTMEAVEAVEHLTDGRMTEDDFAGWLADRTR